MEDAAEKIDLLRNMSYRMKDNPKHRTIQQEGVQMFVSLVTAYPAQLENSKICALLTETDSAKRVLRACSNFPHCRPIVYESLVFIANASRLGGRVRESLVANAAIKCCIKSISEWNKTPTLVLTGLAAIFSICSRSISGLSYFENSEEANVCLYKLLNSYGLGAEGGGASNALSSKGESTAISGVEGEDDILSRILAILALYKGKKLREAQLSLLTKTVLEVLSTRLDNPDLVAAGLTAISNLTHSFAGVRKIAVDHGLVQISTSALFKHQGAVRITLPAATALNNVCQSQNVAKSFAFGDGRRTIALMVEQLKLSDKLLQQAVLNFISTVGETSGSVRTILKQVGAKALVDPLLSEVSKNDDAARGRIKRALAVLKKEETLAQPLELNVMSDKDEVAESTKAREEAEYEWYREEFTGRRMLVGMNARKKGLGV